MNVITVTGLIVVAEAESTKNGGYFVRCKKNLPEKNKDGSWTTNALWPTLFLTQEQKAQYDKMKVKPGSGLNVVGHYSLGTYVASDGNTYINFSIIPDRFEYSTGISDSGLFSVTHTNGGIVSEITQVNDNFAYCDVLFDEGYGENKKTERVRACFSGTVPSCVTKGKRIDFSGRLAVALNQGKDGKTYLNRTVYVKDCAKTPFFPKKAEDNNPAPEANNTTAPTTAPTAQTAAPQEQFDLSDFDEVDNNSSFF